MIDVRDAQAFRKFLQENSKVVAYFWAGWCEPCKLLDEVLTELERCASSICCLRIEAEECPEISGQCNVAVVPLFLFFSNSTEVDRLEGADAAALTEKFSKFYPAANAFSGPSELPSDNKDEVATYSLTNILKDLVNRDPIMLFMKGTPDHPQCGFSAKVVDALRASGSTSFGHFNILEDDEVRQGLKEFSNWPTYPQLYVNGDLVGGCDIIMEMAQSGELKQELEKATKGDQGVGKDSLDERIQKLIHEKPVMLFMKGSPDAPRCGFSRKVVEALDAIQQEYGYFDILGDEAVRQGLKAYSNWPTYPQLYVHGELLGGCDIIMEMAHSRELKSTIEEMRGS